MTELVGRPGGPEQHPDALQAILSTVINLLRLGLLTNTAPKSETPRFELTPRGLQYVADYDVMRVEREQLNHVPLALSLREFAILRLFEKPRTLIELPDMGRVSVLIPAKNEAKNIVVLLNDLTNKLPGLNEVVVVDASGDETAQVARALGARVIIQDGKGKGAGLRQAFAADYGGDIIVSVDADGSNRIEEIPRLVEKIIQGADIAKGSRFLKGGGSTDLTWIRKIGNRIFLSFVNRMWLTNYTDLCYGFIAYKKSVLATLAPALESEHFEVETEIFIKAHKLGLKVVEVPSVELSRRYGTSKLQGIHDSIRISKTILYELLTSARVACCPRRNWPTEPSADISPQLLINIMDCNSACSSQFET